VKIYSFRTRSASTRCPRSSHQAIDRTQPSRCIPLDSVLKERDEFPDYLNSKGTPIQPFGKICAIKIDVEGYELAVIKGTHELIERHRPVFICEFLNDAAASDLGSAFARLDYRPLPKEGERNIAFICEAKFDEVVQDYGRWSDQNGDSLVIRARRLLSFSAARASGLQRTMRCDHEYEAPK
jgi:Methyltransferase FkbM domain